MGRRWRAGAHAVSERPIRLRRDLRAGHYPARKVPWLAADFGGLFRGLWAAEDSEPGELDLYVKM